MAGANYEQRDAAFSNIFGGPPPPGRSQTMTSQSISSPNRSQTMNSHILPSPQQERSSTMTSHSARGMQQRPPPTRQYQNGFKSAPPPAHPFQQNPLPLPGPPRQLPPQLRPMQPQPHQYPGHLTQSQQQRQYAYPASRADSNRGSPQHPPYYQPQAPRIGGQAAPSLNSDPFRTQSLASQPRPNADHGPGGMYNIAPAHTFRQQQYIHSSRTTPQGRVVPERPDERTMSMSSYARGSDHNQTQSGRVIPSRQRMLSEGSNDGPSQVSSVQAPATGPLAVKQRSSSQNSVPSTFAPSRSTSMASTLASSNDRADSMVKQGGISKSESQRTAVQRRAPLVYPALLSKVAECFRQRIQTADESKDGLDYKNTFTGEDAVTLIAYIIKTTDRNLALLLGRSLDAQKFFHDVTYQHRLRDMNHEIYQFRETLVEDNTEVNGVFTLLTECYSPTCTRDLLCYSIACPRRLEQQARLNMKARPILLPQQDASLHDDQLDDTDRKLWIHTVSKELADSVSDMEKKRQEVISELMYTERDFVKDLEYLRDCWMKPLRNPMSSPIPDNRRERFVRTVFSNAPEVYQTNARLADQLTRRQQVKPVVHNVGDIFLENVPHFHPFIAYGAAQLYAKFEFENEKRTNPAFARFVDDTERLKESRKLELNGYLTKPTTRLARYPLLLEGILKYTADDNPDKTDLPKAIAMIRSFLSKVNDASGKAENHFNLMQLSKELKFRAGEYVDLKLADENRQLVFKSSLKKTPTDTTGDIQAYLFDHAVLLVRTKTVNKREELKVYRKPIPLELLVIGEMHDLIPRSGISKRPSSGLMTVRTQTMTSQASRDGAKQAGYPITFKHLGKGGYDLTLYCSSSIQQQKWMEAIDKQQTSLRDRSNIFVKENLNEGFFTSGARVNCCVPIDGARKLVIGTDSGVYVCDRRPKDSSMKPRRALDAKNVTAIDVLEQHSILLVLADKSLFSYPLEALSVDAGQPGMSKRGRKICHANFFKAGICQTQLLVCAVKTSALSSTIRVYEPMDSMVKKSKKSGLGKLLTSNEDVLKPFKVSIASFLDLIPQARLYPTQAHLNPARSAPSSRPTSSSRSTHSAGEEQNKRQDEEQGDAEKDWWTEKAKEFYIPTESSSIHFLRSKLCVGCARGFEIVSLETLEAQSLLDQADTSLDFVQRKETIKPIFIERIQTEFLLCYSDYSFFVNRNGWRARPDWIIAWEGNPTGFAIFNQYILAFEPSFIEIRHMETGMLVHIITAKNVRMLHSSTREILYAYEDELGADVVASLDFWARPQSSGGAAQPRDSVPEVKQIENGGSRYLI